MSDGLRLLSAILAESSLATFTRLDPEIFNPDERPVYDFINEHRRAHRTLPQQATVSEEIGTRFPRAPEPLSYYIEQVYERHEYNQIHARWGQMREAMTTRNMEVVRENVRAMSAATRAGGMRQGREIMDLQQASQLVVNRLRDTRGMGGITGVETNWPRFDMETGGFQDADLISFIGRPGMGKCMHPDTPVIRFDGRITAIKNLKPGDLLMGPDSQPRTVLSTTTGREEMFKVIPTRGDTWECNRSHILVLRCNKALDHKHTKGSTHLYSVDEFLSLPSRVQRALRLIRTGVEFPAAPVEVTPYYLGVWLGDGSIANGRITTPDPEVRAAILDEAERFGMRVMQHETRPGFCPQYALVNGRGRDHVVMDFFRADCIKRGEKRIPVAYLHNSRENRLALLAGLVDTDGHLHEGGYLYEIVTKFEGLRDDILYLARSLGLGADCAVKMVNGTQYQRITITGHIDMIPTRVPRKRAQPNRMKKDALLPGFRLESQGEGDYFGITLDRDHLYLLGDFTITHNTYVMMKMAHQAHLAGHNVLAVTTEMGIEQFTRRHTSIALGINPTLLKRNMISTYMERRISALYSGMAGTDRFRIFSVGMNSKVNAIESFCQEFGPSIVFIDGAYLLRPTDAPKNANRIERITGVMDELKGLTLEANVPFVITSQFNRQAGKGGKEGSLETVGYTDAIGTHSSIVVAIKAGPTENPFASRYLEFLKGREGESGEIAINFKFAPLDMEEFTEEEQENASDTPAPAGGAAATDWMT